MKIRTHLIGLAGITVAASAALVACNGQNDMSPHVAMSADIPPQDSTVAVNDAASATSPVNDAGMARNDPPNTLLGNYPTGAGMPSTPAPNAATAALTSMEAKFLAEASTGGQYELAVARLAADRAADSSVKSYAAMLVGDHTETNLKLQQLAQRHNLVLPTTLPTDKQQALAQLSKATGPAFDRQFIQTVGLHDHKADIGLFEQASQDAKDPEIREFASSALPTLRAHLSAAQNLPPSISQ
jgi:putative membrane protein